MSKDFHASFEAVRDALLAREVNLNRKHYVVVPDKCSLYAERFMFEKGFGAFDVEIVTFNRLYTKFVRSCEEFLPKSGAVMLLRKVIDGVKKGFKVFKTGVGFPGFALKMFEAIRAAQNAGLKPEDLSVGTGAAGLKLRDIALVYNAYLKETEGKFVDTPGRMRLLNRFLASADLSQTHFYIAGFDRFTHLESEILAVLEQRAAVFMHYSAQEPEYKFGQTEFYEAAEKADRIKAAAKRIRHEVINGAQYSDFCLISPSSGYAPLARILTEFDIPFYIDQKLNLSQTELFRFLELSDACAGAFRRQDMIQLSKNYYTGVQKADSDVFENYVNAAAINYKRFLEPFTNERSDTNTETAESVRKVLVEYLTRFSKKLSFCKTAQDFYGFLSGVFELCGAAVKTAELSLFAEADLGQVYDKLLSTAELVKSAGPQEGTPRLFFNLFSEGVSAIDISLLPEKAGALVIGGVETFRAGKFRQVLAIDFCDGSIPEMQEEAGFVTDAESAALKAQGILFGPTAAEANRSALNEAVRVLASAEKLFLAYSEADGNRISTLAAAVARGSTQVSYTSLSEERRQLYDETAYEKALQEKDCVYCAAVGREVSSKSNALEMLIGSLADKRRNKLALPFLSSLRAAAGDGSDAYLKSADSIPSVILPEAGELFFRSDTVSVSRIQEYFTCPYKSFATAGLRLTERDTGEVTPIDVGNFLHRAAELFVKKGDFLHAQESMREIASEMVEKEYGSLLKKNRRLIRRVSVEAVQIAKSIAESYQAGAFKNLGVEMCFGQTYKNDLQTVTFSLKDRRILLRGKIDRVDVFNGYARVIDYKTGRPPKFSGTDLYYGRSLQLAAYLKVVEQNGYKPAGMFYYPLSSRWDDDDRVRRFSGVFNDGEDLVLAADKGLGTPGFKSTVIPAERNKNIDKAGNVPLRKSDFGSDTESLSGLADYAVLVIENALREINGGYIAAAPCEGICAYCGYGAMCGFDIQNGRVRTDEKISREDVIAAAGGARE